MTTLTKNTKWRHSTITIDNQQLRFLLKRSTRKSIGLRVSDEGLVITAPTWVTKSHINDALVQKANWISKKMQERSERLKLQAMSKTIWQDGGTLPYLGTPITLQLNPALSTMEFSGNVVAPQPQDRLGLPLAKETDSQRVQDLCHSWLQQQAKRDLTLRLQHFLAKSNHSVRFHQLRLASPAKRWGSCSSTGTIMLNWRLMHFSPAIIDYVVAHEVAHLKEMNHSPLFWQEVERLLPEFYAARQQLKPFSPTSLPLF